MASAAEHLKLSVAAASGSQAAALVPNQAAEAPKAAATAATAPAAAAADVSMNTAAVKRGREDETGAEPMQVTAAPSAQGVKRGLPAGVVDWLRGNEDSMEQSGLLKFGGLRDMELGSRVSRDIGGLCVAVLEDEVLDLTTLEAVFGGDIATLGEDPGRGWTVGESIMAPSISDGFWLVPENTVYDTRTGDVLDKAAVQKARKKEHKALESHNVYELVSEVVAKAKGYKIIGAKWVNSQKGPGEVRSRLVATQVNKFT